MNIELAKDFILQKLDGLSPKLTYHGKHHTYDVLEASEQIIEHHNVSEEDANLLRIAVLMHDAGFLEVYANHEEKGCEYAKEWLSQFDFNNAQIEKVCGMIMATKIPHNPKTDLEEFICDADLDYLGTDKYDEISETLYREWVSYGMIENRRQWLERQIGFLKLHEFYSEYALRFRKPKKMDLLRSLEQQL